VEPAQYVLLVSVSRILQSLQHANVRLHFGWLGERLLVSPRYHRMHHAIGVGHENHDGKLGGCNFAVLLPVGHGVPHRELHAGVCRHRHPRPAAGRGRRMPGREYGRGFWSQQWLGLKRMVEYARKEVV
jgi:hypothetical protein